MPNRVTRNSTASVIPCKPKISVWFFDREILKVKEMFNVYYINYAKAFEIAMQMDNKILEQTTKEHGWNADLNGQGSAGIGDSTNPLIAKLLPKLDAALSLNASKSSRTSDTIKVVSTKSTVLAPIVKKAIEVKTINDSRIGNLIKIKNVSLSVLNTSDIMAARALMSGLLNQIPVEGIGQMNLTGLADTFLKGAAYILTGDMPERVKTEETNAQIILKIPMQMENELESQYCISDIAVGPVTVIGIYRGKYNAAFIKDSVDALSNLKQRPKQGHSEIETDTAPDTTEETTEEMHYIDVIAVIQELTF